jgi:hypothetical protein
MLYCVGNKQQETQMPSISVSKMIPGQNYRVDGQALTFVGTRGSSSTKMDANPIKFGYAAYGDRWVFHNDAGIELGYKKGYDASGKPGLVPENGEILVDAVARIVT